jgi:hypothetical protein
MSASSAAASSTLTRSKAAILIFTSLATAYLIYRNQARLFGGPEALAPASSGSGLRRRGAVRRRRTRTNEGNGEELPRESFNDAPEDRDTRETVARPLGDGETVVDEPWHDDWSNWGNEPPSQRNGQNIVQLLFRVSEDATRRNAYVHRGCQCNSCGTVPIRGIRYRCSNCADFDLCEACEAQGLHIKTHIFYKVRVPTSSFATRQMQPVWYPGDPDTCMKSLPKELMARLSKETGFDRPELDAYWEQWTFMANTEWREDPDDLCLAMDRKTFDQCLVPSGGNRHAAPNLIHDRMFAFYDTNNDELISFPEFLNGLAYRKKKDKLKRVFEGFDIDGDGYVDRKDFLRMFRSYYVLYKQMHRDMLDGLDDQVMNSTDAHQLITSRQPISSAFGRDGRFPPAPNPRTGEGKSPGVDGDLIITDGKGVISDSGNDLGNKEDVIIDAVVREYPRLQQPTSWAPTGGNAYWRAVTNPPETIASLQYDVLEVLIRERRRMLQDTGRPGQYLPNNVESEINEYTEEDIIDRDWPPSFVTTLDVEAVCGEGTSFASVRPSRRPEVVEYALRRLRELSVNHQTLAVNEEIHERWKRRQFYTDEEEGAVAPPDWKEEEDIPYLNGKAAETSKETMPPSRPISPRSRSSSKVRFAEDTDDFETRSNPSTSSRSIPERWGGMEVPDAEKDAGKEVLYQVTQQACNELIDQLFKKQEDLAVAALSSKKARDKYRHLFTNPNFEQWALGVDKSLKKSKKKRANISIDTLKVIRQEVVIPEVELPEIRQRPLHDLLVVTGYTVDPEAEPLTDSVPATDPSTGSHLADSAQPPSEIGSTPSLDSSEALMVHTPESTTSVDPSPDLINDFVPGRSLDGYDPAGENEARTEHESTTASKNYETHSISFPPETEASQAISASEGEVPYRDPTFPQFRPNSFPSLSPNSGSLPIIPPQDTTPESAEGGQLGSSDSPLGVEAGSTYHNVDGVLNGSHRPSARNGPGNPDFGSIADDQTSRPGKRNGKSLLAEFDKSHFMVARQRALEVMPEDLRKEFAGVDWKALYELREMEALEKQAEARGGWGTLSWEEFEQIIKGEDALPLAETSRRSMMDFLGSWIEFCIP